MEKLPQSVDGSIQRLLGEGYALYRRGPYIVVAVPYLDAEGNPHTGLMADTLNFDAEGRVRAEPTNHQMYFVGLQPHDDQHRILFGGSGAATVPLFDGKTSSFYWSWKQKDVAGNMRDYQSLYEKFVEYVTYVSGAAEAKFPHFKITPFIGSEQPETDCPFPFEDMNSARADLRELDKLLEDDCIAIIGAGGTGSYIFDLISKTRVKKIRLFDFDVLDLHNAFRIPGATEREELGQPKVDVIEQRYRGWHKGIQVIEAKLDRDSGPLLEGVTFAFLAVDKITARREIAHLLLDRKIPFIVVGMGLHHGNPGLTGMVETTVIDGQTAPFVFEEIAGDQLVDLPDDYDKNIQTVELNALNAAVAVFMYKKYRGYYASSRQCTKLHSLSRRCNLTVKAQTERTAEFEVARGPIPSDLSNGIIYVNPQANRAHHLCACGCGSRVLTPLNDWEWSLVGTDSRPSLDPSIGNWNLPCQSHYWIIDGKVLWARRWTREEIVAGRAREQRAYVRSSWRETVSSWFAAVAVFVFRVRK